MVVIIAVLFKVSSALYVCKREKALGSAVGFRLQLALRTANLRPSAPTQALWSLLILFRQMNLASSLWGKKLS